ncbi:MAG: hypothetical protein ACJ771_00350, partial [Chloroflexota bacterium]
MEIAVLLPIAAFVALAAGLAVVLRGTGKIVARTREVEHFRGAVKDLAARVDASLGGAAGQIDAASDDRPSHTPPGDPFEWPASAEASGGRETMQRSLQRAARS